MLILKKICLLLAFTLPTVTSLFSASTKPIIVEQPRNITECLSGDDALTVKIVEGVKAVYQWQKSNNQTDWVNIEKANSASYVPPSNEVSTNWYRVVVNIEGDIPQSVISNISEVKIAEPLSVRINFPSTKTICTDDKLHLTAETKGGAGDCTFQWQVSRSDNNWQNIEGETKKELTVKNISSDSRYRVTFKCSGSGCCN